jgi:protein-L-isoaspartate(D-aspartate) O-methyltransferase
MCSETDDPAILYQDIVVGLFPDRGINNGEPSLHAKCLGAALPSDGDLVVHVGAGTGYYTAIIANLVGRTGRVHAYEVQPDIARRATENLSGYTTVTVHAGSALEARLPPADVNYVSAGATHVPSAWLDALAHGGRLVLPLTPNERLGCMLLVTRRSPREYAARVLSTAAFIPCIGARDDTQSIALANALDARSTDEVRSLKRGIQPDETAWCVGDGWWLSTAE